MIIARGKDETDKSELLVLGLSLENVLRMACGKPMTLTRKTHGDGVPEGWHIVIIVGETELAVFNSLKNAGLIPPDAEIRIEPKLGQEGT